MANTTEKYTSAQLRADPALFQSVLARAGAGRTRKKDVVAATAPAVVVRKKWQPAPAYDCYLGIDPGVNTGIAIRDTRGSSPITLLTLNFWKTVALIHDLHAQHGARLLVVIEDPNVHKSLYANKDNTSGNVRTNIAQKIGSNKREASLLLEYCRQHAIGHDAVAPLGKLDARQFAQLTGLATGSQHARDAARLIFNR